MGRVALDALRPYTAANAEYLSLEELYPFPGPFGIAVYAFASKNAGCPWKRLNRPGPD